MRLGRRVRPIVGRRVAHYEVVEEVGRSVCGVVYQARDTRLGRTVALRFFSPHLLASRDAVALFEREAQAVSVLNHPQVAVLYDVGEDAGQRYLVLEYLPGGSLETRRREMQREGRRFSLGEIGWYALQVCAGLAHAHRRGVIHGEVKSGNVMFSGEGAAKITDFGLARCCRRGGLISPGASLDAAACLSPEQARGEEADPRSDVFGLGMLLHEMATGDLPRQGAHEAVADVRPDLPEGFGEIVARATAEDPRERYQNVEELAEDLRRVCQGSDVVTVASRPGEAVLDAVTRLPQSRGSQGMPRWRWLRSWRVALAATVLVALGLALPLRDRLAHWLGPAKLPERKLLAAPAAYDLSLQGRQHLRRYDLPESLGRAISAFQQALQQDPNYAPALASLGEAYARKYRQTRDPQWIGEAQRTATRAVDLNDRLATAYLALGMVHHDEGRCEEAIARFQRALKLDPVDPAAHRELARAFAALGRHKEAVQAFQKAIDLGPDYWAGHSDLGDYYFRYGRDEDAARCFLRAAELAPDSELAYRNLGAVYLRLGRLEEAARMAQRSLELRPTSQGRGNLGVIYEYQGRFADAVRIFQQAVQEGANDRGAWGNLAEAHRWASEPGGKAAETYRQAVQLAERDLSVNPRDAEARASLALYCLGAQERARALREIAEAGRLAYGNKNVLFQSVLVYEMSGRRERALEELRTALQHGYPVAEVHWHPDLASLRKDSRFASVLASAGVPRSSTTTR